MVGEVYACRAEQVSCITGTAPPDLYRTYEALNELRNANSSNGLLHGRGLPGTHDLILAKAVLNSIVHAKEGQEIHLPIFDKSAFEGYGDRSVETIVISPPIDVFILEGWSIGFSPLGESELARRYEEALMGVIEGKIKIPPAFLDHTLESLIQIDNHLAQAASTLYPVFTVFVQIRPESHSFVYNWRLQQEHHLKLSGKPGMSDQQVQTFVRRYMPGYELWANTVQTRCDDWNWKDRGLVLGFGPEREVQEIGSF
jgi:D-glycerate 3-kinase